MALTGAVLVSIWGMASVVPNTEALQGEQAIVQPVEVTVSRGTLSVPKVVPPAPKAVQGISFVVSNYGHQRHSLAISAAGSSDFVRVEGSVEAGTSNMLTADLKPGSYTAYCPVEGHQAREQAEFTVAR